MTRNLSLLLARSTESTYYDFARAQMLTDWWQWMVLLVVCVVIVALVIAMYVIDSRELPRGVAITLTGLRLFALAGLFFFFLQLEQRTTQTLVKNSRMHLLIDTSLSMEMKDREDDDESSELTSRISRVVETLEQGELLADLRMKHDVICYRFDEQGQPTEVATFPQSVDTVATTQSKPTPEMIERQLDEKRNLLLIAGLLALLALPTVVVYVLTARKPRPGALRSWALLIGAGCLAIAVVLVGVASLRNHQVPVAAALGFVELSPDDASPAQEKPFFETRRKEFRTLRIVFLLSCFFAVAAIIPYIILRLQEISSDFVSWFLVVAIIALATSGLTIWVTQLRFLDESEIGFSTLVGLNKGPEWLHNADRDLTEEETGREETREEGTPEETAEEEGTIDWVEILTPSGESTRLGDAVQSIIQRERGGPIAGIVVISDGCSNAGRDASSLVALAKDARIPIYAVGMGSRNQPINVRVVELEAPPRAHPEDSFTITGYLQGTNLMGRWVEVELTSSPESSGDNDRGVLEDVKSVVLGGDGEDVTVTFEIEPSELGRREYTLRVIPPGTDHDSADNQQKATVEIVDRRTRVLLFAGGPTREYRFLRNLLYRDREMTVDVCIQSAPSNISQDADEILLEFPRNSDDLFEYDCIVAFDPDWRELDEAQADLLERWIAEKAGGLIAIAGPVFTPRWAEFRAGHKVIDTIKGIYPVTFSAYNSGFSRGRFGSEVPLPIEFTDEGNSAEFLRLEDDSLESQTTWARFDGVFGYYNSRELKSGAYLYSLVHDETGERQIYMASQFYGSGRVFYMASGEIWRIRALSDSYFEQFYTKLVRYAAEGRLLRDSSRGVLLVDKSRCLLRETIAVRAQLSDALHAPLTDKEVTAVLISPTRSASDLVLRRLEDTGQEGMYIGEFAALQPGRYHIELPVPGNLDEMLSRDVVVRVPRLEREDPSRRDELLLELSKNTDGKYYVGMAAASGGGGIPGLAVTVVPRAQSNDITGTPDRDFQRRLMTWLLSLVAGALGLEWLIRRLSKLA